MLFLRGYSSNRFQILYSYSTYIEDLQRRKFDRKTENCLNLRILRVYEDLELFRLNVLFRPGCFSKIVHGILLKFSIDILQILKMCNVVVLIAKFENCQIIEYMRI